jgi:hypothetical protein
MDCDDYLRSCVLITESRCSDVKMAGSFPLNRGSIVAMDRGYSDYAVRQVDRPERSTLWHGSKDNARYEVLAEGPIPATRNIRAHVCIIGGDRYLFPMPF